MVFSVQTKSGTDTIGCKGCKIMQNCFAIFFIKKLKTFLITIDKICTIIVCIVMMHVFLLVCSHVQYYGKNDFFGKRLEINILKSRSIVGEIINIDGGC